MTELEGIRKELGLAQLPPSDSTPVAVEGVTKVYVAASYKGFIDYDQQLARQGFEMLDVATEIWRAGTPEPELSPSAMIIGGVDEVRRALHHVGKRTPAWNDYPPELGSLYGRRVWTTTWGELEATGGQWFVKRPGKSSFLPGVMTFPFKPTGEDTDWNSCHVSDDTVLLASEPVEFVAEWRAFCVDGKVLDVRQYSGHWGHCCDANVVLVAAQSFRAPVRGYSIDVGLTNRGRTLVVETNAGHSLGAYGLRPDLYARLLAAAWSGVWGQP